MALCETSSTVTCTAVLKTNKLYENALLVKQHSQPAHQTAVPVEQCRQSMKSKASTTNDKPHQIFILSAATAPNEVKARLPAADTIKSVLRRVRSAHRPKYPQTVPELIINDQWGQTTTQMRMDASLCMPLNPNYNDWPLVTLGVWVKGRKEMLYLTTQSIYFIYGYMASDICLRTILIVRKETRCCHIGYSFRLAARVLLYTPSHRPDSTYHGLCYTSRGALAGTRNSSMGPPHEGSIRRPIAP